MSSLFKNVMEMNQKNTTQAPAPAQPQQEQVPWMLTTAARGVGSVTGLASILFGILSVVTLAIVVGGILICEGIIITLIEAPCFFAFFSFGSIVSDFVDKWPAWLRATMYLGFAIVPFAIAISFSTFVSCGLMVVTSALYLLQTLGKKASADEMRVKASNLSSAPTAVLVSNEELPAARETTINNSKMLY